MYIIRKFNEKKILNNDGEIKFYCTKKKNRKVFYL